MNLDEILAKLQKKYIKNMPDKIKTMDKLIQVEDFKSLREEFHKIKGTGRTYGLAEVSDLGALFEEILILSEFQPKMNWALDAYDLFKDIYDSRSKNKVFNIGRDPRYKNLQSALETLKK